MKQDGWLLVEKGGFVTYTPYEPAFVDVAELSKVYLNRHIANAGQNGDLVCNNKKIIVEKTATISIVKTSSSYFLPRKFKTPLKQILMRYQQMGIFLTPIQAREIKLWKKLSSLIHHILNTIRN
jgi:hypothetical protein